MSNIVSFLKLSKGSKVLDLPCGKGRHSLFLNELGFETTGADLSANSIAYAKQFEKQGLFEATPEAQEATDVGDYL